VIKPSTMNLSSGMSLSAANVPARSSSYSSKSRWTLSRWKSPRLIDS
jgi:hypothetical protein